MSAASPERPSRRAAARRKVVVEEDNSSDVENSVASSRRTEDDEEEEFTPAPARSTRASPRRKTTGATATTPRRRAAPSRRTRTGESVEPSTIEPTQVFSPPDSVADEPASPTKRSPPKRRSVKDARAARQSRASRVSIAPDPPELQHSLLTPEPTVSPEPASRQGTPLADITESTINEQTPKPADRHITPPDDLTEVTENAATPKADVGVKMEVKKVDPSVTKLEKPMDIVVRTKALGIPQSQEHAAPKARMTITYLTLTNFKSYAGRQEVGPFHASFSSVVGPNGSGKSNVIDSLLFVFGFRASKMRQGKISALIHNSAEYPDLDHCEVEVHFQEVMDQASGGCTVVPDSQLVVSRRAFKNNSSKYYINGRTSDFTSVTTLLKDRGIDLDHKRFLILQGEVESIAQMKPKAAGEHDDGLLEYLEDIIGTSKYKQPIDEAATETEGLNETCAEKSTRVQHVEKEKNGLEDKKNKAVAYIHDENELASKQSALYQIYVAECGDNIQVTDEAIGQIQEQLSAELQRHGGSEDEIKRLEKQFKVGTKEYEKLEKDTQGILKEMAKLDKENVQFEAKMKFLEGKKKKSQKTIESAELGIKESETLGKQAEEDVVRLTGQIEDLEQQMVGEEKELTKVRESLKGKTQGLSDQIAAKQKQLEPWNAKISEKQSAMAVAQSELDILRERENAGATATAEVKAKIAALQEQRDEKSAELEDLKKQRKTAEKEVQIVQKQVEQLATKEPAMKAKLSGARSKADEARASLSATQSQGNVLSGLTRLKDSGRIDGFHGRLGNLGAIDQKYDVAISTACPSLDNLVVDTVENGQQCIDYLRKNNLGRANFILLDRLPQRDLSPIDTPENVPRLFDLVKSKHDRFKPAFYSVLQNTLVAKDLEQANRIAYGAKRWRVVTLDGQLIDKSGTMSGGGTKVAKGGMSSKLASDVSKEQVAKMEVDRDALEQEYAELQESQRELNDQLSELQGQVPRLETQAQKLGLELDSIERNIADAQKRIQELAAEAQPTKADKGKVAALERSIDKMQLEMENLQSESAGIEDEIKELQEKIMEVGGVKLRVQKGKVDGLKEQIDTLNESLGNAEVSKTKAEKQRSKHQQSHAETEKEMAKIEKDLGKVEEDGKKQTSNTAGFRRQAEEAEQALEEKRDELGEVKTELDDLTSKLNETRGVEVEMRNKLEESQKILLDNQKRLKYWEEKLSKLTMQTVTEEGEEKEPEPVPELSRDELADLDKEDLKAAIATLEERTSAHVELAVLAEYRRRVSEYNSRLADLSTSLAQRDAAKSRTDNLRRLRLEGFMEGFSIISMRLKEMYQMITMGGNAELELVDSLDPFSEGILFSVMPPKKSWKNIGNLSGGEKTLSSLALVFALHHYRPTPLYVMDEIDAALDFRNVSIVAAYIKERTKNAQFIVISLRNNMFELASRLVGVYKVNHMTKSVTIENRDYIVPRT
ncbi:Structural maintenance of chromosomes protein 4 [Elasticomyces elasticus]|nr:Structural maintenance of chromosomes protein 4 [Elasticomyces elasticus]KAK3655578.1 Structural maintenance of chromosomes protein 4 [Elasticomyces elasticus]KAK4912020.1 Structural maintenance of chromosomes protein 4 [Elasticomyces elasticus]